MNSQFKGGLLVIVFLMASIITPVTASAQPLTSFDFNIVGLQLKAEPEYQAVPKGIATQVNTFFDAGEVDLTNILDKLPQDYTVRAELSGPAFQTPLTLVTRPGQPFDIPTLALFGKYTLSNIRLTDNGGNILFGAVPQVVTIESIDDPLITEVSTRPLTVEELQERGVTFDSSNFTAYEFTAAIATESGQVQINLPVLIPSGDEMYEANEMPPPSRIGLLQPPETNPFPQQNNISISGFMMSVDEDKDGAEQYVGELPSIPGILVIPGNIGFLHQYFSALSIVSNGAPEQSNLLVTNVHVKMIMPVGEDLTPGTDEAPGDDPLRMAKGTDGFFPRELPVLHPGADGTFGTSDDISQLYPAESGQADFTIEGLKEGTHKLDFEITATLEGLPIGPISLKGYATGAVLVRNPDFSVTMSHPATVRSGEPYDLFITVTNTGQSIANLVSVNLDPRAVSGAVFAGNENQEKLIDTILPGSSSTVKYRLLSQRTGKVTASAFASEDVQGRFVLRTGVGENGIPLSPDSLILPYTGDLPPDLINAVVGLLGQAWSVATAPAGALPADVLPISKRVIVDKANNLSEAGLRLLLGDADARAIGDLAFDLLGSDEGNNAFDRLRRSSTQGALVNAALASVLQTEVETLGLLSTQANLSDLATYREAHLSFALSEAAVQLQLTDAFGNRTGGLNAGDDYREIAYADRLILSETGTARSTLLLATRIASGDYTAAIKADADTLFDFGVVVPDAGGMLHQLRFTAVNLPSGGMATLNLTPGTDAVYRLNIDHDADGVIDESLAPSSTIALFDRAPKVVAATQIVPGFGPGGDEHGRTVAVLFSERVDKATAEEESNYLVESNGVRVSYLQPGGRIAFILLDEGIGPFVERTIAVENILDGAGSPMQAETRTITITAAGPAAKVSGAVRLADGTPVANATVRLLQPKWVDINLEFVLRYFIITEKTADAAGNYSFDYVLRDSDGPFMVQALNPESNEMANLTTSVMFHGQDVVFDLFMKARGNLSGTVYDADGNPVANAQVLLTTLEDKRSYVVTADAGGQYAFLDVNVGPFSIKAISRRLFAEGNSMGVLPDNGESIVLDVMIYQLDGIARGDVVGKVTNADGTPRAGVIVIVEAIEGTKITYSNWIYSGIDGSFNFIGVHARDQVRVRVRDDATGETGQVVAQLLEGETAYFNLILQGTSDIKGLVRREDLKSAEGMLVSATFGSRTLYATVDVNNHFVFTDLPVGMVTLRLLNPENYELILVTQTITLLSSSEPQYAELFAPFAATLSGTITGTVYRLDGSIAAGAEVRLIDFSRRTYRLFMTDSVGRFEIPDMHKGKHSLVVINGREVVNQYVEIFLDGQVKDVELRPFGFGTISGTVYDEGSGMMPVGADVSLYGMQPDEFGWLRYSQDSIASTKSDPQNGSYRFTDIYQGMYAVRASNIFRPTPAIKSGAIVEDGESITANLVLKDSFGSVSGQVLLPDGTPAAADIRVTITFGGAAVVVTTGETGLFVFEPMIPAGRYQVTAEDMATTLIGKTGTVVRVGADTVISIRLLGRGTLNLLVKNTDNSAESGADVAVRGTGFPYDTATGTTDAQGFVTLSNLCEGNYAITATGSASRAGRANTTITSAGELVNSSVTLASYGKVTGTFLKSDRVTPVSGGQITLMVADKAIGYAISSANPATLGQFTVDFVPLGAFSLEGYDPVSDRLGHGAGRLNSHGDTVFADVVVVARGMVKGSVLNFSGTSPVGNASVTLFSNSTNSYNYTLTAAPDGTFQFAGVPEGAFTIRVTDPDTGLRGQAQGIISFEGETRQVEIRVAASGSIEGVVLMPDGTPATNAVVNLNNGRKASVNPADGTFHFTDLAIGTTYAISAQETGTNRAARTLASLAEDGAVARPEIVLAGIGTVSGVVYRTDGSLFSGATVNLSARGAVAASYTQITPDDGTFSFAGVPASEFSLTASYSGALTGAAVSGQLLSEGDLVSVEMKFGDIASVIGQVLLPDGITPANGGVARFRGDNSTFNAVINSDGNFAFNNIPLCSFNITFEDSTGTAIGTATGEMAINGEIIDVGVIVLDDKPIAVVGITPVDGTINVPVETNEILIKFSEPADTGSINSSNIRVLKGSTQVSAVAHLDSDGLGVRLVLNEPLESHALYTVVVSAVKDLVGWTMDGTFISTFTSIDNVPPTVVSLSPQTGTVQVSLDSVLRVTFSEPVNVNTLQGVRLLQGGFPVETRLNLTQGNTVAILTPVNYLQPNLTYAIEISGVEDSAGNVLPETISAVFNSLDTLAPAVISLTVAADSVLIEGLLVGMTAEVLAPDVVRVDFYHDNLLLTSDTEAPFTVSMLMPASGLNYYKAIAEDAVGNRGTSTPLTLDVAADQPPGVTIDTLASGLIVANGSTVYVAVSARDDIDLVNLGLTVSGSLVLSDTRIVAGMEQMAQFFFTVPMDAAPGSEIILNASATDSADQPGIAQPVVLVVIDKTLPALTLNNREETDLYVPGATGSIAIIASDNVGVAAINCSVTGAGTVENSWSFDPVQAFTEKELVFTVAADAVAYSDIMIDCSTSDASGNSSAASLSYQVADVIAPSIISSSLADGAVDVPFDIRLVVTFDEPLAVETVNSDSVRLTVDESSGDLVYGRVHLSSDGRVVTFVPHYELDGGLNYTLTLASVMADTAGNTVGQDYLIQFTTSQADVTAPYIVTVSPSDGEFDVSIFIHKIIITFNEPIDRWSLWELDQSTGYNAARIRLDGVDGPLKGFIEFSSDGLSVSFNPNDLLDYEELYTITLRAGLTDLAGNALLDDYKSVFQTPAASNLLRAVYYDPSHQTSWISRSDADKYHSFLVANGFISLNATQLAQFMTENGPDSMVVMSQDVVPETIAASPADTLFRQYLNRSGSVIWTRDAPFMHIGRADGSWIDWGVNGMQDVLEVQPGIWDLNDSAVVTAAGKALGLYRDWPSSRAVQADTVTTVLATDILDQAAGWFKNYNSDDPKSGFYRVWGGNNPFSEYWCLEDLMSITRSDMTDVMDWSIIARYHADGNWYDAMPSSFNGVPFNVDFSLDSQVGYAAGDFRSTGARVSIGDLNWRLFPSSDYSIEAWVKLTDIGNGMGRIVTGSVGVGADFGIGLYNDKFVSFTGDGTSTLYASSEFVPNIGEWYHLVSTRDGKVLRLYVNGELVDSITDYMYYQDYYIDFWIGNTESCPECIFSGLIDEVVLYDRTLTGAELLEHYQTGLATEGEVPTLPTVTTVAPQLPATTILLAGTKDVDSAILVDGVEVVPVDGVRNWRVVYVPQPGKDVVNVSSRNLFGNESASITVDLMVIR
jgi:hypothetical protein